MKSVYVLCQIVDTSPNSKFSNNFVIEIVNFKSAPAEKKRWKKIRTSVSMADQITMYSWANRSPLFSMIECFDKNLYYVCRTQLGMYRQSCLNN